MALHKLKWSNYGGKLLVTIKRENLHSFKEGLILLCQSIFETRRMSHLHDSALFTIPLRMLGKGLQLKSTTLLVLFLWLVKSLKNL